MLTKKIIWALVLGIFATPAAYAAEEGNSLPTSQPTDAAAVENLDIEKYMENAIQNQLQAIKSSLPTKVGAGITWKDILATPQSLNYVYEINVDEMLTALPEIMRKGFDGKDKQEIIARMKTDLCPQIEPMLCLSLDMMSTFSPKLTEIAATYSDSNGQTFANCTFTKSTCAKVIAKYNQQDNTVE